MKNKWIAVFIACVLIVSGCSGRQAVQTPMNKVASTISPTVYNSRQTPLQFHSHEEASESTPIAQTMKNSPLPTAEKPNSAVSNHSTKTKTALSLADLREKYPNFFVLKGPGNSRQVALTFDDAPDMKYTPLILDVLKQYNVKATFFVVGYRAEAYPAMVKRMANEGHAIGNHSYNHANLPKLSAVKFRSQIERTQAIILGLVGYEPRLFRPPYGAINEEQLQWAAAHHFIVTNWNVDSLDWKGLNAQQVSNNILSHVLPGSIVLQHSGGGEGEDLSGTVEALPHVIRTLRANGFQFVTVPDLLNVTKGK